MALFLAFMALVLFSAMLTMKAITWGRTVNVPSVVGKDTTSAIVQLKDAGLEIKVERQEHHPTVPAGSIISQSPPAGNAVKKGRDILVVVSLGSEEITVPKITGENFRRGQILLKQAGLVLGEVQRVPHTAPREEVVQQDPLPGTILQKGAGLDLLVSDGPRPAKLIMPDLTGMTQTEAASALKPLAVTLVADGKGTVGTQDPKPGYPVISGSEAKITLGVKPPAPPKEAPAAGTKPGAADTKKPAPGPAPSQTPKPEQHAEPAKPAPQPTQTPKAVVHEPAAKPEKPAPPAERPPKPEKAAKPGTTLNELDKLMKGGK